MKKLASIILSLALVFLCTGPAFPADRGNTTIQSFSKAKKILLRQVYKDHRTTFYCGCPFNAKKQILPCDDYTPKRDNKRAHRLEWEHIVPAHAFGQSFPEWRNGHSDCVRNNGKAFKGRNCARKAVLRFSPTDDLRFIIRGIVSPPLGCKNACFYMFRSERSLPNCGTERRFMANTTG